MSILQQVADDAGTIGNSSASAAIVGVSIMGIGLPDIVAIISAVYFLISTVFLVAKFYAWHKDRRAKDAPKTKADSAWSDDSTSSG